jgi:hypothetical protein
MKKALAFFNGVLLSLLLICQTSSMNVKSVSGSLSNNVLIQKSLDIFHFSNQLREKHMGNLSLMQNYLTTFAQVDPLVKNQPDELGKLKNNLKTYFKTVKDNMDELNQGFTENYDFCVNKLKTFTETCDEPVSEIKSHIEYNKRYARAISSLNDEYDSLINNFYDSNVFSLASNICDLSEKNDIVDTYAAVGRSIDQHFNILKSDDMQKVLAQVASDEMDKDQTGRFLQVIMQKFDTHSNTDFMQERKTFAQILFNKVSSYMNNAISRKTRILNSSKVIFNAMQENDNVLKTHISDLKRSRKDNSELSYSLNVDNQRNIKKMKNCENLNNLNTKCEETAALYKSILKSYEGQSESIQNIYKLLMESN